MLDHLANFRAVCFPPYTKTGFVTVEAHFASRKPVVTCSDSGGPAELVIDGVSGKVAPAARNARCRAARVDGRPRRSRAYGQVVGARCHDDVASAVRRLLTS